MVTLLYPTLQSTLECDTVIRRTWVMAAGSNFTFHMIDIIESGSIIQNCDQTAARLLLTAYRNSSSLYPKIPSPTFYDVRFSYNKCLTDKRHRLSYPRLDLTVGQKSKA